MRTLAQRGSASSPRLHSCSGWSWEGSQVSFDSKARISPLSLHPISTLLVLPPVKFLLTTHTHPVSVAPAVSFRESKGLALPSPQTDPLLPAPWVSPCCMKTGGRGRHGKGASRIVFGMLGKCGSCEFKYRSSLSLLFFFFNWWALSKVLLILLPLPRGKRIPCTEVTVYMGELLCRTNL